MKRIVSICVAFVLICFLCIGCEKAPSAGMDPAAMIPIPSSGSILGKEISTQIDWAAMAPVPFSGYICGTEGSDTFLQIPVFLPGPVNAQLNGFISIQLTGSGSSLRCSPIRFFPTSTYNEKGDYTLTSIELYVELEHAGEYTVDTLSLEFDDGSRIEKKLGEIQFLVEESETPEHPIYMSQCCLNQMDLDSLRISYTNSSEFPVTIVGLELPDALFGEQSVKAYHGREFIAEAEVESLTIPAGETHSYEFSLQPNPEYFQEPEPLFLFLPNLIYSVSGQEAKIPAQIQATVIDHPYPPEYVEPLLAAYSQ